MIHNQFLGMNPLLHSLFQAEGSWEGFHTNHLTDLTRLLRAQLIPLGYTAEIEESMQIRRAFNDVGSPESDVTIYDTQVGRVSQSAAPYAAAAHELVMSAPELLRLDEPDPAPFHAVGIYTATQARADRKVVAWIELLSPSNKPGGRHAQAYWDKRFGLLDAGIVFVELDYLHESPPTFHHIPDYRTQLTAHAYRIIVVDPRPTLWDGKGIISQFDVDVPIPTVTIPLSGADKFDFDFNAPYQKTFEEMLYGLEQVDYSQPPMNFDRYSRADQARILTRLLWVRDGGSEDRLPAPLPPLSYDDASSKWG